MLQQKIYDLFASEISEWGLAREKYQTLSESLSKRFDFGDFAIDIVCNKARIRSTMSDVKQRLEQMRTSKDTDAVKRSFMANNDSKSCFLCADIRPIEQKSIAVNDFHILVNPFPIFPKHFTITHKEHIRQQIVPFFDDFLFFAKELPDLAIFYNGANCGASAPFHTHFQAAEKQYFNVLYDFATMSQNNIETLIDSPAYTLKTIKNYLRKAFCITTKDKQTAKNIFIDHFYTHINKNMLNIIAVYEQDEYHIIIFPRKEFRPTQFFEDDENKRLAISPASVEMSGRFVTIFQEHFDRITKDDVVDIYSQISE